MGTFRNAFCLIAAGSLVACDGANVGPGPTGADPSVSLGCAVTASALFDGGPGRDGIPALIDPALVPLGDATAAYADAYLERSAGTADAAAARVVGLMLDGTPIAIPHNVLWWHEIVNIAIGERRLAVTYCPLTGSALVFDLVNLGARRFGVSGLIFQNNLVMFDEESESLWPQLCRSAAIGPRTGTSLVQVPAIEMRWETWKTRHPSSLIVGDETGFNRDYSRYPYRDYESSDRLLFAMAEPVDPRRPIKERVFGLPNGSAGIAFPFGELERAGETAVIGLSQGTSEVIVLWDGEARAAAAFFPRDAGGNPVTLRARDNGFVDAETNSVWDVEGQALSGPRAGQRLIPFPDAFVAFWFAWSAFHPQTSIWTAE